MFFLPKNYFMSFQNYEVLWEWLWITNNAEEQENTGAKKFGQIIYEKQVIHLIKIVKNNEFQFVKNFELDYVFGVADLDL